MTLLFSGVLKDDENVKEELEARNHDWNEVLRVTDNPNSVCNH